MPPKEQPIQARLQWDLRLHLEYGAPLDTIPYQVIATFVDDGFNFAESLQFACELVEREKDYGRPRAFVTSESEGKLNIVFRVWSWCY